jgi:hypothetical protein
MTIGDSYDPWSYASRRGGARPCAASPGGGRHHRDLDEWYLRFRMDALGELEGVPNSRCSRTSLGYCLIPASGRIGSESMARNLAGRCVLGVARRSGTRSIHSKSRRDCYRREPTTGHGCCSGNCYRRRHRERCWSSLSRETKVSSCSPKWESREFDRCCPRPCIQRQSLACPPARIWRYMRPGKLGTEDAPTYTSLGLLSGPISTFGGTRKLVNRKMWGGMYRAMISILEDGLCR